MNLREIKEQISEAKTLSELTKVYGEIAGVRMKRIRGYVLKNREFLFAIEDIFKDALASYSQKLSKLVEAGKMKEGGNLTFLAHNGKSVSVYISANTGFYGEVVKNTFRKFAEDISKNDDEVTIIGKIGRSIFVNAFPKKPYVYFDFPDYGMDHAKFAQIISHLVPYEEIKVYYGKYESVVTQKPEFRKISAGTPIRGKVNPPKVEYLYEPSIEDILIFFETQIFASIFDQAIRESQLSKFASRILAMDLASQNIEKRMKDLDIKKLNLMHKLANTKQLNSLVSIVSMN